MLLNSSTYKFIINAADRLNEGLLLIDNNYTILYVNNAFCKLADKVKEELIGKSFIKIFYNNKIINSIGKYVSPIVKTIETDEEIKNLEVYLPVIDRNRWFSVNTYYIKEQGGNSYTLCSYVSIDKFKDLEQKIESLNLSFVKSYCKMIQAKDNYTAMHSDNVAKLMTKFAKLINLDKKHITIAYIAGVTHDIGKISIPEKILNKPGKLTDREFEIIKSHPRVSSDVLNSVANLKHIANIVLYHHERYDGKGYPEGLRGNSIPFLSRMLALCDSYDAMTSKRCYSPSLNKKEAIDEIKHNAGTQFDPELTKIFIDLISF